jgi:catechol 2,3-dioxygenase-like lactoylglutathione lyase family enzyme
MLVKHPISPTLPATNLERARSFYAEKLGLTAESETPAAVTYRCGAATSFILYPSQRAASGTHTEAAWVVDDLVAEVASLKARGVVFEEYDLPELRTVNSIATTGPVKAAWLKDCEGNLLNLVQFI